MRRKISGLVICAMLVSLVLLLTSCGGNENIATESTDSPLTITLTTIGDATNDAVKLVENRLNKITEAEFNTRIVLNVISADEYQSRLDAMLEANFMGQVEIGVIEDETADTGDNTNVNVKEEKVFPKADKNQLDIFLVPGGYEQYAQYATDGYITEIGAYLEEDVAKILKKHIPSEVIEALRTNGGLYGIPSNVPYGDCEYLLVNKELYAEYNYAMDESTMSSLTIADFEDFLVDVANDVANGTRTDIIPLYNISSMNLISLTGKNSAVAKDVLMSVGGLDTTDQSPKNILTLTSVQTMCRIVNSVNQACGIMPVLEQSVDTSKNFAAGFVTDNVTAVEKYSEDYYVIRTSVPRVDQDELCGGLYAVSAFAGEYAERCVEIITALNTDKTFRNIIAYGVENEHYIVSEESGMVSRISDDYRMDIYNTGNVFLVMQNDEMTEEELLLSANNWKIAIEGNSLAKVSPYARFVLDTSESTANSTDTYKVYSECVDELEKLYNEIWVWVSEYPEYVDPATGEKPSFAVYLSMVQKEMLGKNVYVQSATSSKNENSIFAQYKEWYDANVSG